MNKIYEKSGKLGSILIVGTISGLFIVPLLSFLYGKFSSQFSISFFDTAVKFIIFGIYLFILIGVQTGTINVSKCRNKGVKLMFLTLSTIASYFFSWIFFVIGKINGVINFELISTLFFNPSDLVYSVKEIFFRSPGWNTFFWISELIGFALVPVISYVGLKEVVFCEDCNKWTDDINFKLHLMYESLEQLQEIAERDVQKLLNLPIAENLSENHIVLNFQVCDSCLNTNTVNIDLVTFTSNNGTVTRAQEDYGSIILISSTLLDSFKSKLPEIGKTTSPNTDEPDQKTNEPDQKTNMNKIYENSGKFGSIMFAGAIVGICIIPLLSFVYGSISGHLSGTLNIDVSNLLIKLVLFGGLLLILISLNTRLATLSKSRNSNINLLVFSLLSGLAYCFSWVFFVGYQLKGFVNLDAVLGLILNPYRLYVDIMAIYDSLADVEFYYWIAELLGFIVVPFLSLSRIKEVVFCESCNKWVSELDFKLHLAYDSTEQLKEIAAYDIQKLLGFPIAENLNQNHIVVNFHACNSCLNTNTLNFDLVTWSKDEDDASDDVNESKVDFSPVICISSSELEVFKNKSEQAKKLINNQVEVEYLKTSLIERFFYSRTWKWSLVITAILLSVTYVIEPFLGVDTKVEVCESIKQITNVTEEAFVEDHVDIFYEIKLVRKNKEISPKPLRMPSWIGENINKGDTITSIRTKWRNEPLEIKLKDGLVFPTKDPYGSFLFAPILLIFVSYVLLQPINNPPKTNVDRKGQKVHRYYYLIVNFLCSIAVFLFLYMSVKILF
jgi:tetrahydromethanopterin S-methyltransferase subunit B